MKMEVKQKKRNLVVMIYSILGFVLLFSNKAMAADEKIYTDSNYVDYTLNEEEQTCEVSGYLAPPSYETFGEAKYTKGDIVIPAKITVDDTTYTVTSVGVLAFYRCKELEGITLPDTVKTIGNWAFRDCIALKKVVLGKGVYWLQECAFYNCCKLETINFPESIQYISEQAFSGCEELKEVDLSNTNIAGRELQYVFSNCSNLVDVKLPDCGTIIIMDPSSGSYIEKGITLAGTFFNCTSLENIDIPDSVREISYSAFNGCKRLNHLMFHKNIQLIRYNAFIGCDSLTDITIDEENKYYSTDKLGNIYNKDKTEFVVGMYVAKEITIPDTVRKIQEKALYGCHNLCKITIPANVTEFGNEVFNSSNEALVICGYAGSTAETYAKNNNIRFQSIVTDVGNNPKPVEPVNTPSQSVPAAKGTVLTCKAQKCQVVVTSAGAKRLEVAYRGTTNKKATKLVIPDTVVVNGVRYKVTSIKAKALKNNKKVKTVTLGKNVTRIEKEAFSGCKNLSKITIKSSNLKSVGKNAIKGISKKAVIQCPKKKVNAYKKLFKSSTGYKKTMKIKKQ